MKILFLGDVVARSGRQAVLNRLPALKRQYAPDLVILNGENSAHGKGITSKIYDSFKGAGVDLITLGNHAFSKSEILVHINECCDLIRPANMDPVLAGSPVAIRAVHGKRIAVINLLGSVFMPNAIQDPIPCMEQILKSLHADQIFVDFHGEATSEKLLFYHVFRKRVTAIVGTHTHVQTADEQIQDGCAYITDAGMCGPFDSIIGRDAEEVIARSVRHESTHYTPSELPAVISGVLIETDDSTNRAVRIIRIMERPA